MSPPSDAGAAPRRSLIVSGSIGQGHASVAEVCADALAGAGGTCSVVDAMALLGSSASLAGERVFRRMLRIAPLYDALHFSQLRAGTALADAMDRAATRRLVPRLRRQVEAFAPDLLVAVFATGAGALARLRPELPGVPTVVVCTDASAHRLWVHPGIDRYLVFSDVAAGTVRQYQPGADVVRIAPAVRGAFYAAPSRHQARQALGAAANDDAAPWVLLSAGGWGGAPLERLARAVAAAGCKVLAVAGRSQELEQRLQRAAGTFPAGPAGPGRSAGAGRSGLAAGPGIVPFGYSDRMPELMAAADVVVTTAGQTCHEARVVGRPLVLLDAVPGHGRENLLLELAHGGALACRAEPGAVRAAVESVLAGEVPPGRPWPIASPDQWHRQLLAALPR